MDQRKLTLVALMTEESGSPAVYTPALSRQGGPDISFEDRHYSSQLSLLGERYTSKIMICKAICEYDGSCSADTEGVVISRIILYHPGIMPIAATEEDMAAQIAITCCCCQNLLVGSVLTESLSVVIAWRCSPRKTGIGVPSRLWRSDYLRSPG